VAEWVKRENREIGDYLLDETTVYRTSKTGGTKGSKIASYSQIPVLPLAELASVYGMGAFKYPNDEATGLPNYMLGMPYSWHMDAVLRHWEQFRAGVNFDPQSGLHVLAHSAWYSMTLMQYQLLGIGEDDRHVRVKNSFRDFISPPSKL
jgi:hypothetical protein